MSAEGYVIRCQQRGCDEPIRYKVAAEWSDNAFEELKTYALACAEHLEALYRDARRRAGQYKLSEGEQLNAPGIYEFAAEGSALPMERRRDLEAQYGG